MEDETEAHREARLQGLWRQLDPRKTGHLDFRGLKDGLALMQHRKCRRMLNARNTFC